MLREQTCSSKFTVHWICESSLLKGAETVQELLEVAKDSIPPSHWKRTPVVLKATAGLRLLPEEKAEALLFEVHCCFVCLLVFTRNQ